MFIGRKDELEVLKTHYKKERFEFIVVYGRRRVGKTSLLSNFTKKLPVIFFTAVENNAAINLQNLSQAYHRFANPNSTAGVFPVFSNLQAAFEAIFELAKTKHMCFVIDEYPYLAKADKSASSVLQMLIDKNKSTSKLFLVACGSSLSFMREQVLSEKSPLYGRRTAQLEIKPFDFFEARKFFPNAQAEDVLYYYSMAGGIPLYLEQFSAKLALEPNIEQAFLHPSAFLFEEPTNLIKQEVQKAATYNAVIAAIASGKTTCNEIATTINSNTAETSYYLKELQRLDVVLREMPVCKGSRRAIYKLNDNLFLFWYKFILPSLSLIERNMPKPVLAHIKSHISEHVSFVFEQVCKDWLWRMNAAGTLGFMFDSAGRWWGNNAQTKTEEEIDIVCTNQKKVVAVAECKWKNELIGTDVAKKLIDRANLIKPSKNAHYFIFAKTGFTKGCEEFAGKTSNFHLVDFEGMAEGQLGLSK